MKRLVKKMTEILSVFTFALILLAVFGLPLNHLYQLIRDDGTIDSTYEEPEEYRHLAMIQVGNMGFLLVVYFVFWWILSSHGPGSISGILLLPFIIMYFVTLVTTEKKINRLVRK